MLNIKSILVMVALFSLTPVCSVVAAEMNEDAMRAYYAAWTNGDVDAILGYFSDDIVYADIPAGKRKSGKADVRIFVQKFVDNYAGVKLTPASITIGATSAAVEWVMSGGTGEEAWSVPGMCAFQLKGGLITSATDYWHKE